ncbi:MAG: CPBP family intramembrane metalloprotease [Christensenellaceae bacterium]|jgi:membrane protease YdiL (CAAX protease family)|nr:CPBP family intramembrane metalloprotease [Christensenellaceae bacterium]
MTQFRSFYKLNDSSMMYGVTIGVSLVFSFFLGFILVGFGVDILNIPEWLSYILNAVLYLLFLGAFLIYSKIGKIDIIKANEFNKKINFGIVGICVAISVICILFFNSFIGLVDSGLEYIKPSSTITLSGAWWAVIGAIITMTVMPAIIEEFIFRGVIFKGLLSRFKPAAAIVLSALMFALFHFEIHQFVYQFILGIVFACIVYYTGSIVYSMIVHFFNNFIVIMAVYFSPLLSNIEEMLPTDVWSAVDIVLAIGLALVGAGIIIGLIIAIKKLSKSKSVTESAPETVSISDGTSDLSGEKVADGLAESSVKTAQPETVRQQHNTTGFVVVMVVVGLLWILFAVV